MVGRRTLRVLAGATIAPLAALTGLSMAATNAQAATRTTVCAGGCAYTQVADAVAAAPSGAVITVGPGTYAGGFIITRPVTIRGAGWNRTVISGGAANLGTVVEVRANPVTISGVRITAGTWSAGTTTTGGGVVTDAGAVLSLSDCSVAANRGSNTGGGAGINSYGTTHIFGCSVSNNTAGTTTDPGQGGGIHVGAAGSLDMADAVVNGNVAGWGGGFDIDVGGSVTVVSSLVFGNTALHQGGGLDNNGALAVTNALIFANRSNQGGGLMINGRSSLRNSWVEGNASLGGVGTGGGAYVTAGNTLTRRSGVITHNTPDNLVTA